MDQEITRLLDRLDDDHPLADQVAVFTEVHQRLQDALAALDDA